jgi:hypothetical protein
MEGHVSKGIVAGVCEQEKQNDDRCKMHNKVDAKGEYQFRKLGSPA